MFALMCVFPLQLDSTRSLLLSAPTLFRFYFSCTMDELVAQAGNLAVSPPPPPASSGTTAALPASSPSPVISAADEARRRERQRRYLQGTTVVRSSTRPSKTERPSSDPPSAAAHAPERCSSSFTTESAASSSASSSSGSSSREPAPRRAAAAARTLDCVAQCRLLPLEGPEFLVRWSNGEESWEHFGTVTSTANGTEELRDYYIRTMPDDIWQDALKQRGREAHHMVLQLAKLKRLLPVSDAPLMAQFDQVERAMGNMSLLTDTAASIAAQGQIVRWRINQFMDVVGVLDDLPHGEYFKTFDEFKAATHKADMAKQELQAAACEERRQQRVDALVANPTNPTEAAVIS